MSDPQAVSHVGGMQCPHCLILPDPGLRPVARLDLYLCPGCEKTFVILSRAVEFTTHPTQIDPTDIQ